jgi:hypothetical protein
LRDGSPLQTNPLEPRLFTPSSASRDHPRGRLPHLNEQVGLIAEARQTQQAPMSARVSIHIDDVHARAICEEIGERLRETLNRAVPHRLPPRLQHLIERLAAADHDEAPSIVPSLDDTPGFAIRATSPATT